jgi:hypothetical protein
LWEIAGNALSGLVEFQKIIGGGRRKKFSHSAYEKSEAN